jgi:hypothetical protein
MPAALTLTSTSPSADLGLGYIGGAESVLAVVLDDECLHAVLPGG